MGKIVTERALAVQKYGFIEKKRKKKKKRKKSAKQSAFPFPRRSPQFA
jgi:hypothetical protein